MQKVKALIISKLANKDFMLALAASIIPILIRIVYIRSVSYLIPTDVFGAISISLVLIALLSQLSLALPSQAFRRFYNENIDQLDHFRSEFRLYLFFLILFSFFVGLAYFKVSFKDEGIYLYLLVYFAFVIEAIYSLAQSDLLLGLKRKKFLVYKIAHSVIWNIIPVLCYIYFKTIESFFLGIIISGSCFYIFARPKVKLEFSFCKIRTKKYFTFAYPIIITSIASWSIMASDRFFIDHYMDKASIGVYSILYQVGAIASVFSMVFMTYVNPLVLKKYEESSNEGIELLYRYANIFSVILVIFFGVFLFTPRFLLELLISPSILEVEDARLTLNLITISVIFSILHTTYGIVFFLKKKISYIGNLTLLCAVINFICNFSISKYGLLGAAGSTFISYFLLFILTIYYTNKVKDTELEPANGRL
ncbi:MAG: hypothetical protein BM556_08995 [Bacteriovorax sp. MedPE-SWde]|nr:MAG: hypothetical protein BM556_08995 [Bacteriovorax sp. MedPE-SWde]